MKNISAYLLFFFALIHANRLPAQDIHFSQYYEQPLLLNPGATGVYDGYHRALLNYKNQWTAMGAPYRTMAASFDLPVAAGKKKPGSVGLGLNLFSDKAGDGGYATTQGNFTASGIVKLDKFNKLSAGIQGGAAQQSINFNSLSWQTQYTSNGFDPNIPSGENISSSSFIYADFSAGVFYEFSNARENISRDDIFKIHGGAAAYHVNRPYLKFYSTSNERLPIRWVGFGYCRWDVPKSKISLVPSFIYFRQGPASEVNLGTLMRFRMKNATKITGFFTESAISFGANYRWKDAVIAQFLFEIDKFAVGVSYDVNVSSYRQVSNLRGGIEISLKFINLRGAVFKSKH
jgi:type IX secretion system PorP/SprF family membrane protein